MKKIGIKNIKSFKDEATIEIKPITVFVGKNSCGKSSLVRFPVVLAQSLMSDADTPILFFGKNIDYGNYEDVIHGHSKKDKMEFSVSYQCVSERYMFHFDFPQDMDRFINKPWMAEVRVGLALYSKRMIIDFCNISIEGKKTINIKRIQSEKYRVEFLDMETGEVKISANSSKLRFINFIPSINLSQFYEEIVDSILGNMHDRDRKLDITKLREYIFRRHYDFLEGTEEKENEDVRRIRDLCKLVDLYSSLLLCIRGQALDNARNTYYIGPFRENPSRVYRDVEHQVDSVGPHGEDVSVMLKNDYSHGKKIISRVSEWLKKSMNYELTLKDIGGGLYNIVVTKNDGTGDNIIDVGYGISQVLPIVTQLMKIDGATKGHTIGYSAREEDCSTFVIEQPELHLHPGAQAELASLFVDVVSRNNASKSVQVIIETHSEHLIRKLQSLIANKDINITEEQVKVYYVDKNDKNEAFVTEMHLLKNGQFAEEWPSGFFDKAYELSLELIRNNM